MYKSVECTENLASVLIIYDFFCVNNSKKLETTSFKKQQSIRKQPNVNVKITMYIFASLSMCTFAD